MNIRTQMLCLAYVAVIIVVGSSNLQSKNFSTMEVHVCASYVADQRTEPNTVLFVGSSRTGAGIDPKFIEAEMVETLATPVTVDRLITWRSDHAYLNLLLRNYIKARGAPKNAVLEFTLRPEVGALDDAGFLELPPPSIHAFRYVGWKEFSDAQEDNLNSANSAGILTQMQTNHFNFVEYVSHRITQGFYHFLRNPLGALSDISEMCEDATRKKIEAPSSGLVFDSLNQPSDHPQWTAQKPQPLADYAKPPFLEYPENAFQSQLNVIGNTISLLQSAGVEHIFLLYMPKASEVSAHPEFAVAVKSIFPDVEFVELVGLATAPQREEMASQFRDGAHLTPLGARVASTLVAEFLLRAKSD